MSYLNACLSSVQFEWLKMELSLQYFSSEWRANENFTWWFNPLCPIAEWMKSLSWKYLVMPFFVLLSICIKGTSCSSVHTTNDYKFGLGIITMYVTSIKFRGLSIKYVQHGVMFKICDPLFCTLIWLLASEI